MSKGAYKMWIDYDEYLKHLFWRKHFDMFNIWSDKEREEKYKEFKKKHESNK